MIIKATTPKARADLSAVELAELMPENALGEDSLRAEAARIIATAKRQAEQLRREAVAQGRREGAQAAREELARQQTDQWATVLATVESLTEELRGAKQVWLAHWEKTAMGLALAIARRVLRRELAHQPDVAVDLVREALELAAGSGPLRVLLSPVDHCALGPRVEELAKQLGRLGPVEVTPDETISPGGCRVETRCGIIDQQFEAQLARIEEELR